MSIFDKKSITDTKYDWFKNELDASFSIPNNKNSKVIFGFNGIGKTTIFNCIKETGNSTIEYLNYFELRDTLQKGKVLTISANINQIGALRIQMEPLVQNLNGHKILKDTFGFSNQGDANAFGQKVFTAWKDKMLPAFTKKRTDIQNVENQLNGVSPKTFISAIPEITAVHSAQQELQNAKDQALFYILSDLDNITEASESVCPICGNSAQDLKQTIQTKMNALSGKKSALVEKLKTANVEVDATVINNLVTALSLLSADEDLKAEYVLSGGSSVAFDLLSKDYAQLQILNAQLLPLLSQAQINYKNIINTKDTLESDLKKYFNVDTTKIIYDNANYTITITFPRELKTYSTGELNLVGFLYRIYSFIGSDKTVLLLDDPASSLDLVNHYKIAYEVVKNSKTKTLIVLTHSVEFINVINSQYPGNPQFEYYYLEKSKGVITIQPIVVNTSSKNPNIISLDKLSDTSAFSGFIGALQKRETDPSNATIQTLFHYSTTAVHLDGDATKFSNYDLLSLIENFTSFNQTDFYKDSYLKVQYLCALRIWLEKKLYLLIPSSNLSLQTEFMHKDKLREKIDCILPRNSAPTVAVPGGFTRDVLMSKKVMLNQGVHYYSQIMPFAYAINLSLDMLSDEILELKALLP